MRLLPFLSLCLLLAPLGCASGSTVSDRDLQVLSVGEVAGAMREAGTVLVDVRSAEAFAAAHLPGAIHIHLPELYRGHPRLSGAQRIVVYGRGWDDLGLVGAKKLLALGYVNVFAFPGGLAAWRAAGREVESGEGQE